MINKRKRRRVTLVLDVLRHKLVCVLYSQFNISLSHRTYKTSGCGKFANCASLYSSFSFTNFYLSDIQLVGLGKFSFLHGTKTKRILHVTSANPKRHA